MDRDRFYERLDIEDGSQFVYFENFAELVEGEQLADQDLIYELLMEVDHQTFYELVENWFEDTMKAVPDDSIDMYTLLETIKRNLQGLTKAAEEEVKVDENTASLQLSSELQRFIEWFSHSKNCTIDNYDTGVSSKISVRDAITENRVAQVTGDDVNFDFTEAVEYPIEEYIMTYGDII